MKIVYTLAIAILLAACGMPAQQSYNPDHTTYIKEGEELIFCESKYNIPSQLLYYKSGQVENKIDVPQTAEPFSSYYITDVLGNVYSINSDEIANYSCFNVRSTK